MCRSQVFTSFTVLVRAFVQICIYCRTNNRQTYWLSWTTQKNRRTGQKPHFLDLCPHRTVNCEGRLVSSYFLRFHNFGLLWCGNQIKSSKVQKFLWDCPIQFIFVPFLRISRKEYDVVMHMVQCFPRKERSVTIFVRQVNMPTTKWRIMLTILKN